MRLGIFIIIIGSVLLGSCSSSSTITVLCEKDTKGNYILRWETYPEIDNTQVEIYMSDNDSVFPSSPSYLATSNDYISIINDLPEIENERKYFRLKIGNTTSDIVSNRFFIFDSIQNFRDIGGYVTNDNQRVRWGKIFRSGSFSRMTEHDSVELNSLGIKTIIDLRSEDVKRKTSNRYANVAQVRIPIAENGYSAISQKVMEGRLLRGDAIIHTQDTYRDMVNNFASQYADLFDYLCDEKNYPIVFHCYLGKDQTGLATYFLLKALDVPMGVIEDDYMISDMIIDRTKLVRNADSLSESRQEALTMLSKCDVSFLRYGISCIREKSGSIEDYMLNELRLTPEKKQKLKAILLH